MTAERKLGTQAEERLIGSIFKRPDILGSSIRPEDFSGDLGKVWKRASQKHRAGEQLDPVLLGDELGGDWLWIVAQLADEHMDWSQNVETVAKRVKEQGLERRQITLADQFAAGTLDRDGLIEGLRKLDTERDMPATSAFVALRDLIDQLDNPPESIKTGFTRLDDNFGGFHKGDLIVPLARPGVGKTAIAITLARYMIAQGRSTLFYSGEMPAAQILGRMVSQGTGIPAYKFRSGNLSEDQWAEFADAGAKMKDLPLFICDPSYPQLDDLHAVIARLKQSHDLEVVFVDYIQRIQSPKKESFRHEQIHLAKSMKALAREHDIAMVCLAQAARKVDEYDEKEYGRMPRQGDGAESSQIEMEADMILGLARKGECAAISVEKHRHGPLGLVPLHFDGPTMTFTDANQPF